MTSLEITTPDGRTRRVELTNSRLTLGRSPEAELSFPDAAGLSRRHAEFEQIAGQWTILDLGSKNGTYLNEQPVTARQILHPGDRLRVGTLTAIYSAASKPLPLPVRFDAVGETGHSPSSTVITDLQTVYGWRPAATDESGGQRRLQALLQAGTELGSNRPLAELFQTILDLAMKATDAARGALLTVEHGEFIVRAHRGHDLRISATVRDKVVRERTSVLVRDTGLDSALNARQSILAQQVVALMAAPLQTQRDVIGMVYLDSPVSSFTKDDLSLLTVMGNVAAVRIEAVRLQEAEQARIVMARELEHAAGIQAHCLTRPPLHFPALDIAAFNEPCHTVGGDYYEFLDCGAGQLALALGDVSGKGMPAALLMMGLQARVQILVEQGLRPAAALTRLNRATALNCPRNCFITFFLCVLDSEHGELWFANAGHNPPLLIHGDGEVKVLEEGDAVLGLLPGLVYREFREPWQPGDLIVVYSDGVSEANNPEGEEFGPDRLREVLLRHRAASAAGIIQAVRNAVDEWTDKAHPTDDVTLAVVRRI